MFRITSFTGYSSLNTFEGCTLYVMISPVFMVKYKILYSLYHYDDVPCTHESLNVDIKRVLRASLPPPRDTFFKT